MLLYVGFGRRFAVDLISGASGFIGARLRRRLLAAGRECRLLPCRPDTSGRAVLTDSAALTEACAGVDRVFHCAGHAHAFSSRSAEDAAKHWQVNFDGTRNLVEAAGQAGVRKFVFLSSVKAMAEPGEAMVDEGFPGVPETAYGQAKAAAEAAVLEAGRRHGLHVVNLRLAMVYGAGGRGNLERMGRLVGRGWFPPLPDTGNHRSLVHVDDVVSAMILVADDSRAAGKTYIVAHHEAPSGRVLFDALRAAQGLPPCCWAVPLALLQLLACSGGVLSSLTGRHLPFDREVLARLLHSAWYSPARIQRDLGWQAQVGLSEGLTEMLKK